MWGPNKKFVFIIIGFLSLVAVAAGVFWFSGGYKEWQAKKQARQQVDRAAEVQARVEEAYRNDTFGGKTPQETLDMFVAALRAEDVELASKYFALDDNLERGKWLHYLNEVKEKNVLIAMANDIEKYAKPMKPSYEGDASFALFNDDGIVGVLIDMELNPTSKVWKIESL